MKPAEYQIAAQITDSDNYYRRMAERLDLLDLRLLHAQMGIETEAGEITDQLKKHLLYGKSLDLINLQEECGDLLWYISLMLLALDTDFESVMAKNIAKLKQRYPEKFTEEHALNRNLDLERRVLED